MKNSMQHWNGNQLCMIDCETTSLDITRGEIIQLAILPLDSNIEPRQDVEPFCIYMQPRYPDRVEEEALKVNGITMEELFSKGFDQDVAIDLLESWIVKLDLPHNKYGRPKKIIPAGQNYVGFDKFFLMRWLGQSHYDELFDYHVPDTMCTACYLNDRAAMRGDTVPFSKVNLTYLASTLKIPHERAHDALQDAFVAAQVYKRMLGMGGLLA